MAEGGLATQHVHQVDPGEPIFGLSQLSHEVEVSDVHLEDAGNNFNRFTVDQLVHFLEFFRNLVEGSFEFAPLSYNSSVVGSNESVIFLVQLVSRPKYENLAAEAQMLNFVFRESSIGNLVDSPLGIIQFGEVPVLILRIEISILLSLKNVENAQTIIGGIIVIERGVGVDEVLAKTEKSSFFALF